jgi:hypothetical protein
MEVHPGVFVSSITTDEWRPDPEVGGEMHVLVEGEGAYAGMSRFLDVDVVGPWTLPVRETILISRAPHTSRSLAGRPWSCGRVRWHHSRRVP